MDNEEQEGIDPLENVEVALNFPPAFDHNRRTFKCRECLKIFPNQKLLYHHQQKNHLKKVKPQFVVTSTQNLKFGGFKCDFCTSCFSSSPSLKSHVSRVHLSQTSTNLLPHRSNSRPCLKATKMLYCESCSAPFATVRSLNMHKGNCQDRKMDRIDFECFLKTQIAFNCLFCQVQFNTKQKMKCHYQRSHFRLFSNLKVFSCEKCDYQTGNEIAFLQHRSALTNCQWGNVCVKCDQCDQMFTSLTRLGPHQRENHHLPMCLLKQEDAQDIPAKIRK